MRKIKIARRIQDKISFSWKYLSAKNFNLYRNVIGNLSIFSLHFGQYFRKCFPISWNPLEFFDDNRHKIPPRAEYLNETILHESNPGIPLSAYFPTSILQRQEDLLEVIAKPLRYFLFMSNYLS